jgi:hypothetical protein
LSPRFSSSLDLNSVSNTSFSLSAADFENQPPSAPTASAPFGFVICVPASIPALITTNTRSPIVPPSHGRRRYQAVHLSPKLPFPRYEMSDCPEWRKLPAMPARKARSMSP